MRNPAGFSLSRLISYGYDAMAIEVVRDTGLWVKKVNAMQLIQSFGMDSDYSTIDFPYLYQLTFVIGYLDFELNVPPTTPIDEKVQAYKAKHLERLTNQMIIRACARVNDNKRAGKAMQKEHASNSFERFTTTDSSPKSSEQNRVDQVSIDQEDTYVTLWSAEEDGIEFTIVDSV